MRHSRWIITREGLTWRTKVTPTIPIKRRFFVTPLKTLISSGFRALNSLNIWKFWWIERFIICNKNKRPSTSYINWYVNLRSSGSRSHVNYCNPLVHSTLIPRTHSLYFFKFCTYLAEDKRIEYHGILHIHGMLPGVIVQPKYTNALEVENQKDSNLIQSLRRVKDK